MRVRTFVTLFAAIAVLIPTCTVVEALPPTGYTIVHQYSLKSPTGFNRFFNALDYRGASVVGDGSGSATGNNSHALLWATPSSTPVDLHPIGYASSQAIGVDGNQIVGVVRTVADNDSHAFLWDGPAHSAIDLHPDGYRFSTTYNVHNGWQYGAAWLGSSHAFKWQGTAESGIDMHPAGYRASWATFGDGSHTVGTVTPLTGQDHAALWTDDDSVIDLNPPGYPRSYGLHFSENQQVGQAYFESGGSYHAFLWSGTAESGVDLNPPGWRSSSATATNGFQQVGGGRVSATSGDGHALLWNGTADSFVDLGALLPVGTSSSAFHIDERGHVFGRAVSGNLEYVIEWAPIPEPSVSLLVAFASFGVFVFGRRCR